MNLKGTYLMSQSRLAWVTCKSWGEREFGSQGNQGPHQGRSSVLNQTDLFKSLGEYMTSDKVFTSLCLCILLLKVWIIILATSYGTCENRMILYLSPIKPVRGIVSTR